MSSPPSLKRCRKNLEQSIYQRNRPLAKFSAKAAFTSYESSHQLRSCSRRKGWAGVFATAPRKYPFDYAI
jgi:hypothetical protein